MYDCSRAGRAKLRAEQRRIRLNPYQDDPAMMRVPLPAPDGHAPQLCEQGAGRPNGRAASRSPRTDSARLLVSFGIAPGTIRTANGTPKGYQLAQFEDAFARYLPGREF
jgi:hypothetical protein